jgi:mitochondrial fission protein ELM1
MAAAPRALIIGARPCWQLCCVGGQQMEIDLAAGGGPAIWTVTDGRAGNAVQALALAEAVARRTGGTVTQKTVAPRPPFDRLPPWAWDWAARATGGPRAGAWPFAGLADRGAALAGPRPALVVGCGRRSAPVVAALRATGAARAVQILAPQMRLSAFDLVVTPRHDRLAGPNVVETLGGLNGLDPARVAEAAAAWRRRLGHLPEPRVAVLVGGPGKSAGFGARALDALCDGLARLAVEGAGLMVTPSRRTPKAAVDRLADTLTGVGGWVWSGRGDNPYPAILGLADAVVVTEDSVNMASEAAATGKPVFVAAVDRVDPKLRAFHDALRAHGASRPFRGELAAWRYEPLREAERVADRAAALLAPA